MSIFSQQFLLELHDGTRFDRQTVSTSVKITRTNRFVNRKSHTNLAAERSFVRSFVRLTRARRIRAGEF